MNRTERAIKKQLRKVQRDKKREKNQVLGEIKNSFSWETKQKNSMELRSVVSDEKKLKEWHRKILSDQRLKNKKEAITA